jgi:hypothetical protein
MSPVLRGVPQTPSAAHPQLPDFSHLELANNSASKTLVFGTGRAGS